VVLPPWTPQNSEKSRVKVERQLTKLAQPTNLLLKKLAKLAAKAAKQVAEPVQPGRWQSKNKERQSKSISKPRKIKNHRSKDASRGASSFFLGALHTGKVWMQKRLISHIRIAIVGNKRIHGAKAFP
jgi:hypothetical protein